MTESVDKRITAWAQARRPAQGRLDALARRVHDHVVRERLRPAPQPHHVRWPRLFYAAAGAMTALLAVSLWIGLRSTMQQLSSGPEAPPPAFAGVAPERIAAAARLAREMNRLFGEDWRWVAESNGDIRMGVQPLQGGVGPSPQPLLLQISVLARDTRHAQWTPVWQSDVLMRSEDVVQVPSGAKDGNRFAFWVLPLANGTLHLDVDFTLANPFPVSSSKTVIVRDGVSTDLLTFREGATEYRVQQTTTLLGVNGGGSA